MNPKLQIVLIIGTVLFFIFIINMIKKNYLDLKYTLTWILGSVGLILIAIFPQIVISLSKLLNISEVVNTVFLIIIFFLIIIVFTLTMVLSQNVNKVNTLIQEVGLLKSKINELEKSEDN